jgi:hypothetical protein
MKKYFTAILILCAVVVGLYYLYDESDRAVAEAKRSFEAVRTQVDAQKSARDATSAQIIGLNKNVQDSGAFLKAWMEEYDQTRDFYDTIITQIADETNCAVIERKWNSEPVDIRLGKADFDATCFKGTVLGDYRDIVRFIGGLETRLKLSAIWKMEFTTGVTGVVCSIEVYLPNISSEGSAK